MTAYIVRKGAQKKKGILGKREAELLHHIKNESSAEKLGQAAEKVRAAQNAIIKCMLHETEIVSIGRLSLLPISLIITGSLTYNQMANKPAHLMAGNVLL